MIAHHYCELHIFSLISLAAAVFLQNCDRTNDDSHSQARRNLTRCLNICMRHEIADPSQNSIAITELIKEKEGLDKRISS